MNRTSQFQRLPSSRANNLPSMKRLMVGIATTVLLSGSVAGVVGAGTAHADQGPYGPKHWCPGEVPVPKTGNHVTDPLNWDWNVCHTYWIVLPGQGNVSSLIWDGDNPPAPPPPPPGLNFCPIPPWCP